MPKKVYVITGATSGIGKALAMDLAKTGERVVIVARDDERGKETLEELRLATQNPDIDLQLCDLSILSSVRNLAEILRSKYETIDVLINNASPLSPSLSSHNLCWAARSWAYAGASIALPSCRNVPVVFSNSGAVAA